MASNLVTEPAPAPVPANVEPPARPLKFWPAVVMIGLFWLAFAANRLLDLDMTTRFFSRLIVHGLLLLAFLVWWLSRGALAWRERIGAVAVLVVGAAAALAVSDASISIWSIFLTLLPWLLMAWVAALYLSRDASPGKRRLAVAAAILLVLAVLPLLRWDGIDGTQKNDFSWRWSPTAEQEFLAAHRSVFFPVANSPGNWSLQPEDIPAFRGVNRDGVVRGADLALDWTAQPPQKIWRQRLGPGWSSLIVVDGRVVTQEQRDESEVVACYDAASGAEIWAYADSVRFHESLSGAGPRGTPAFADGRVIALGGKGNLTCLDATSGKLLWSHDLVAEAGAVVPQWGFAVSPLVVDGKVIVFAPGKDSAGLLAYDAASGDELWRTAAGGDTYSSPQLVELGGVRQVLMHDSYALRAYDLAEGNKLWEYVVGGDTALPMLQPQVVAADKLLVAAGAGLTLLEVQEADGKWTTDELWTSNRLKPNFNDFVVHKENVYGLDDGILAALDLATGERLWKKGRYGHGQLLLLADQEALVVMGARGEVTLVGIGGEQPKELGKFVAIEGKTWNHPALVGQRLFVRNGEEIACYELPAKN